MPVQLWRALPRVVLNLHWGKSWEHFGKMPKMGPNLPILKKNGKCWEKYNISPKFSHDLSQCMDRSFIRIPRMTLSPVFKQKIDDLPNFCIRIR